MNRLHKLLGWSTRISDENPIRSTGLSTSLAHEFIAKAIQEPNRIINVVDHHPSPRMNRALLDMIRRITIKLGYQFFEFDYEKCTIMWKLYDK